MHAAKKPQFRADAGQFRSNVTITIDWPDKHGTAPQTYGGHSESSVVDEHFAVRYLRISIWQGLERATVLVAGMAWERRRCWPGTSQPAPSA